MTTRYWTGKQRSKETRKKISLSLKGRFKGIDSHRFGVVVSEETRRKMSVRANGRKRSKESIEGTRSKLLGRKRPDEVRRKISQSILNIENDKKLIQNEKRRKKAIIQWIEIKKDKEQFDKIKNRMRIQALNQKPTTNGTSIERKMERELINQGLQFKKQENIKNIARVDFLLSNNIVVECDGRYWHNYPFGNKNDMIRDERLVRLGYKVYRFWDKDIMFDIVTLVKKLMKENDLQLDWV